MRQTGVDDPLSDHNDSDGATDRAKNQ